MKARLKVSGRDISCLKDFTVVDPEIKEDRFEGVVEVTSRREISELRAIKDVYVEAIPSNDLNALKEDVAKLKQDVEDRLALIEVKYNVSIEDFEILKNLEVGITNIFYFDFKTIVKR